MTQGGRGFLLVGLTLGHLLKHIYQRALVMLLPSIKQALGLSDVEVGLIGTARTVVSASANIPAGVMADLWRQRVALMLAGSMAAITLGYLLLGTSPNYWFVLAGAAFVGGGASLWHAPAFGTLAAVYPERRAFALAIHRMGGSIGDSVSPLLVGLLLGGVVLWGLEWAGLGWRAVALLMVAPAGLAVVALLASYSRLQGTGRGTPDLREYVRSAYALVTNRTVLSMVLLSGLRSVAQQGLNIFLVLYMAEDLGFSDFKIGYHVALLTGAGIVAGPLMGWLSDRMGRRPLIVGGLASMSALTFLLVFFGTGWTFTLLLAGLGIFFLSMNPIFLATAVDSARRGAEASGVAVMFTGAAVFGSVSPVIAGLLRENFGMTGVFYFSGALVALLTPVALVVPMPARGESGKSGG